MKDYWAIVTEITEEDKFEYSVRRIISEFPLEKVSEILKNEYQLVVIKVEEGFDNLPLSYNGFKRITLELN